ncbi:IS4 family transposase [Dictyobacter arantiisoli]|uniref:IS4 family transposase n=2 Tax=Dictyobacter arantiisoli TaxID=2014874 RepID=A0A5A5TLI2_9CHLR|nr:IS4 family transposase [Dictyobacter arantiisoli]
MEQERIQTAEQWAVLNYGTALLADTRHTARAVQVATSMARFPMVSLPAQMRSQAGTKAAYRLLGSPKVTYERLIQPHVQHTRMQMQHQKRVLLIQDMTEVDYQQHRATTGLGPIGQGDHQGYLLQTVLAVSPTNRQVFGIAAQKPFLRQPAPEGETTHQRERRKQKESQVWQEQAQSIGMAPADCEYIHVGDRGSDIFAFMEVCQGLGCGFNLRVKHNRRVDLLVDQGNTPIPAAHRRRGKQRDAELGPINHLFEEVRGWASQGQRTLTLDGNHKRPQRDATLCVSWGTMRLWPPDGTSGKGAVPLVVTVVRTWELDPPEGQDGLEWMLVTSVAVNNEEQAWERVDWYRIRWIVEDYHQCLKTGCHIEARQMQTYEGLRTLLGFLAPLAVRLLQLRECARQDPERPACEVLPMDVVKVVAYQAKVSPERLTTRRCWHRIAQAGGYLGRKGDGEPGWKTLWKGWLYIQTLVEGIHLASELTLE